MKKPLITVTGRVRSVSFPNTGIVIPASAEEIASPGAGVFMPGQEAAAPAIEPASKAASETGPVPVSAPESASVPVSVSAPSFRPVRIQHVLPEQTVEFTQSAHQRKRREGTLRRILERAPYEIPSPCPHFERCGGCSYQTVPYDVQLQWKEEAVKTLLRPVLEQASCEDPGARFRPIVPSPLKEGYRNKMEFSFGDAVKDGPLELGLHKRGAHLDIVPVEACRIVHPDVNRVVSAVGSYFRDLNASYYHTRTHEGFLRHLVVRRSSFDGALLVNLVTSSQGTLDESAFTALLTSLPLEGRIGGLLHTVNDSLADVVQADSLKLLYGEPFLTEELCGLTFKLSPFSFFQTNTAGAAKLYQTVLSLCGDVRGKTVFDLYCGTGTIGQIFAGAGAGSVYGIELVEEAVEAARENARRNGLENARFLAGDVLKLVDELKTDGGVPVRPDIIVLDPPRDGIHPKALPKILEYQPDTFVYVACKPTSLARDLPRFLEAGYEVRAVCPVDLFPGTYHVETVCLLYHQKDKFISVPYEPKDAEYLKMIPGSATYDEIKEYVLKKYNVKVSSLYVAQVKAKHGIEMRDCYNRPRSENSRQPKVPPEKEKMIEDALRHFRLIEN